MFPFRFNPFGLFYLTAFLFTLCPFAFCHLTFRPITDFVHIRKHIGRLCTRFTVRQPQTVAPLDTALLSLVVGGWWLLLYAWSCSCVMVLQADPCVRLWIASPFHDSYVMAVRQGAGPYISRMTAVVALTTSETGNYRLLVTLCGKGTCLIRLYASMELDASLYKLFIVWITTQYFAM